MEGQGGANVQTFISLINFSIEFINKSQLGTENAPVQDKKMWISSQKGESLISLNPHENGKGAVSSYSVSKQNC